MARKRNLFAELCEGISELAYIRDNETKGNCMTNIIEFRRWNSRRKIVFCFWEDGELKMFKDPETATKWAERQGFKATFVEG